LISEVTETADKWAALDKESGLTYIIKKV
jgi:hypothetical protein